MSRRSALLLLGSLLAGGLLLVGLVGLVGSTRGERPVGGPQGPPGLSLPRPVTPAPAPAVRRLHRALHALGRDCTSRSSPEETARARRSVGVVLDFARRYPQVRFRIDDENGTTVSLLFVTRDAVQPCAPDLTPPIEQLIPPEYLVPGARTAP